MAACLNEAGTTLGGQHVGVSYGPDLLRDMFTHDGVGDTVADTPGIIATAKQRGDFASLNDLAVATIRLGRADAGARLLESLERRWPGRYETATNLGTAYELLGRNDDALRWIREGIVRNPSSHVGTEWVHVRILEAKLAAAGQSLSPDASVLGLDFGGDTAPRRPARLPAGNDGDTVNLWELAQGLRIQLQERTSLVPAPDPVVASLMLDLATLEMLAGSVENAEVVYDFATAYGATRTPLLAARRAALAEAVERGEEVDEDDRVYVTCEICEPPEEPQE